MWSFSGFAVFCLGKAAERTFLSAENTKGIDNHEKNCKNDEPGSDLGNAADPYRMRRMPSTEPNPDAFTLNWLKKAFFVELSGELQYPEGNRPNVLVKGKAKGILCGGNLSLLAASLGTPWEIDTKGKILFLEDIGEKTYRVDGMLTQLRNAGKFEDCAGIILGAWTDCLPEYPEKTLLLPEIFKQLIVPAGKPAICDVVCGHVLPTMSLPLGRRCTLDADAGTIILE